MRILKLSVLIALLVAATAVTAQEGPPPPVIEGDILVEGLNGPQGLTVDSAGNLWITENGVGGDEAIEFFNVNTYQIETGVLGMTARIIQVSPDGVETVVASLPSIAAEQEIVGGGRIAELDGAVYTTHGIWIEFLEGDPIENYAAVLRLTGDDVEEVASAWAHEDAENPDGIDLRETHPYDLEAGPDGLLYYVDAAGNSLVSVDPATGETTTVTAFEPVPGAFPSEFYGGELLAQAVPTGITFDDAGTLYVSYLTGAPFIPGNAKVVTVSPDGEVADFAPGLSMLTDLTYAPDGNLYATQFAFFTQQGPLPNSGQVIRILPDGSAETVVDGLPWVTAVAFNEAGDGYVAINGGFAPPGTGAVVLYDDLVNMAGTPYELPAPPQG